MTKDQYIETTARIESEIANLKKEHEQAKEAYISANRKFADGEKVKVTSIDISGNHKESFAYIIGYRVWGNKLRVILNKIKKDGEVSSLERYLGLNEKLTSLTKSS